MSTTIIATACFVTYTIIAGFAGKWTLKTVKRISHGTDNKITRIVAKDFSIKKHIPLLGYILKDLKISSRNPGTAFFFALPVLETVIVSFIVANFDMLRASNILVSTFMGGIFVLLMPLALLNAEGKELEFTKTLPLKINMILISKTLISTLTYAPVPLVLLVMILLKHVTSSIIILIPISTILAIASASVFETQLFLNYVTKGKISAIIHDLKKLLIGITTLLLPLVLYSAVYLVSFNHIFAVLSMSICSVLEFGLAIYLLKNNKK